LFRVYAPGMDRARVCLTAFADVELAMEKDADGFFTALLPYEERFRGPQDFRFYLNDVLYIHPQTPVHYRSFRLVNYVEILGGESDMICLRDVPHGQVVREVFYAHVRDTWQRCWVYLPPQYRNGGAYPVLYLQHGLTENEGEWVNMGKMPYLMDNLLADGKCEPFIVVMCDGMERMKGEGLRDFGSFERVLIEDCMPFIEKNYRVKPGKENRAMAGLSMGSMQTSIIGLAHPELFDALGMFSGFLRLDTSEGFDDWPHMGKLNANPAYISENYRVFFRSIGDKDVYYPIFQKDKQVLAALGCDKGCGFYETVYPGLTHDWGAFRRALADFAQLIFREKR
ncbi:MAG: hypothetical protein IKB82_06160, partial [Clostridia bacterium]|nr:hypothetical protein [Clostridia bacterium]